MTHTNSSASSLSTAVIVTHNDARNAQFKDFRFEYSIGAFPSVGSADFEAKKTIDLLGIIPDVKAVYDMVMTTTRPISRRFTNVAKNADMLGTDLYKFVVDRVNGYNHTDIAYLPCVLTAFADHLLADKEAVTIPVFFDMIRVSYPETLAMEMIKTITYYIDEATDINHVTESIYSGYLCPTLGIVLFPGDLIGMLAFTFRKKIKR